eukprot:7710581-Prorocentrum_lima.AAC.1
MEVNPDQGGHVHGQGQNLSEGGHVQAQQQGPAELATPCSVTTAVEWKGSKAPPPPPLPAWLFSQSQ